MITLFRERICLGWMTDDWCRPELDANCDVGSKDNLAALPEGFAKFAFANFDAAPGFDPKTSPLVSSPEVTANLPDYNGAAAHSGFLVAGAEDGDGVVRRAQLAMLVGGKPYPSLPLEMARVGLGEELAISIGDDGRISRLAFAHSGRALDVAPGGAYALNFRGGGHHFMYVGAYDVLDDKDVIPVQHDGIVEMKPRAEIFKDAYVLVGVTAIGARDLRHFPFGDNIPGTEGLATVLDNVLADDALSTRIGASTAIVIAAMIVGGLLFGLLLLRLSALPALLASLALIAGLAALDVYYLFGSLALDLHSVFFCSSSQPCSSSPSRSSMSSRSAASGSFAARSRSISRRPWSIRCSRIPTSSRSAARLAD